LLALNHQDVHVFGDFKILKKLVMPKQSLHASAKTFLAIIMLSILIGVASADLAPTVPLASVFIICAIAAAILLTVIGFAIIISANINQFILKKGGTDTAWFWFNREPPGLEKLRDELKEAKK
jgi:hypothetical protein